MGVRESISNKIKRQRFRLEYTTQNIQQIFISRSRIFCRRAIQIILFKLGKNDEKKIICLHKSTYMT